MKTIRRLIYNEVLISVGFITLAFVSLFLFFDLIGELGDVGKNGYTPGQAFVYVALLIPSRLYELLPITVLIGSILVMTRFAQSSEFTILRTGGLGPWRALRTLLILGLSFVAFTFVIGDYVTPLAARTAELYKARFGKGSLAIGSMGAWLKEKQQYGQFAVNIASLQSDNTMTNVRIFEFDSKGRIRSIMRAQSARFATNDAWQLIQVQREEFPNDADAQIRIARTVKPDLYWPTGLTLDMVSVALLNSKNMSTLDLFQYIRHLESNGQSAQRYEIAFWRKVFYPLSCLVMVMLALPFAYLHFRSSGISGYVFAGVMTGISFFLLNNVFGYLGDLQNWVPWLTSAAPGLIYMLLSLTAFVWLVLRR